MRLEKRLVEDTFEVVAEVRPRREVDLAAQVGGRILAVRGEEGERVRRGRAVVEIDSRQAEAQLAQAKASLGEAKQALGQAEKGIEAALAALKAAQAQAELARRTFQRFDALLRRNSVSQQEFDEAWAKMEAAEARVSQTESEIEARRAAKSRAQAGIEQASAALEQASVMLSYTRVEAPLDGIVTARLAEPGDMAQPGRPLLKIADSRHFEAHAFLAESRIEGISRGDEATVQIPALQARLQGRVKEIVPEAEAGTRTFRVKITLPRQRGLRLGMFAKAEFASGRREVLLIPEEALVRRGQLVGAYLAQPDGSAVFRLVETGRAYPEGIEVLAGLQAGEVVIQP